MSNFGRHSFVVLCFRFRFQLVEYYEIELIATNVYIHVRKSLKTSLKRSYVAGHNSLSAPYAKQGLCWIKSRYRNVLDTLSNSEQKKNKLKKTQANTSKYEETKCEMCVGDKLDAEFVVHYEGFFEWLVMNWLRHGVVKLLVSLLVVFGQTSINAVRVGPFIGLQGYRCDTLYRGYEELVHFCRCCCFRALFFYSFGLR